MLKLEDRPLARAGYSVVLGAHNVNDGALLQNKLAVISVVTNPAADETIGIGSKTYTFKATASLATEITIGTDEAATAANILARINIDTAAAGCKAFATAVPSASIILVSNSTSSNPTFTPDSTKIVVGTAWTLTLAETMLEDEAYFKIPLTDANAKPITLVERNSGTYQNFLY